MRIALWIAVLLAAFVLAWVIQDSWTAANRAEQDAAFGRPPAAGDLPEGFSRAVIGAPSGSPPVAAPSQPRPAQPGPPAPAPAPAGRSEHVVRKGETLSRICAGFYGTSRPDLVAAVARANQLSGPDAIREGQTLVLPSLQELTGRPR